MKRIKGLVIAAFCITLVHAGLCGPRDSLKIRLAFKSKEIKQASDLEMTLTIKSYLKQTVYLPGVDLWGLPSTVAGFYIIQVQKRADKNYNNLHIRGALDNIPSFNTDRLHFGHEKELTFPLNILYEFTKGEYRVRVLCRFSTLNKLRDRHSNWTYFTCDSDILIN